MEEVKKENDLNIDAGGIGEADEELLGGDNLVVDDVDEASEKTVVAPEELPEDEDDVLNIDGDDEGDDESDLADNPLKMTDEEKHLGGGEIGLDGDIE